MKESQFVCRYYELESKKFQMNQKNLEKDIKKYFFEKRKNNLLSKISIEEIEEDIKNNKYENRFVFDYSYLNILYLHFKKEKIFKKKVDLIIKIKSKKIPEIEDYFSKRKLIIVDGTNIDKINFWFSTKNQYPFLTKRFGNFINEKTKEIQGNYNLEESFNCWNEKVVLFKGYYQDAAVKILQFRKEVFNAAKIYLNQKIKESIKICH